MIPIKIGTAFSHPFGPFVSSTDGYTIMSALGIGTTNIRINPNGAAAWVSKSTATTPAYQELGYFLFTFTSTDFTVQGNHRVAVSMTSAGGALPVWEDFWASETSELAVALTSGARSTAIDLIWDEALAGHGTTATAGERLTAAAIGSSDWAKTTDMATALTNIAAIQAKTTALPASPASSTSFLAWAMSTDMATALTALTAIQAKTTALPATPASSTDILGTTGIRDAVWNAVRATYATAGTFGEVTESSDLVDDIWDEEIVAGHATTATAGERLTAAAAAGLGTTAVRDAVWGAARATYASTGTFGELIDALWDEPIAGHLDAGSVGNALNAAGSAGDPWATAIPGAYTTAQAGGLLPNKLDAIQAKTTNLPSTPASSTSILTWAMSTDMGTALTNIAAIQAKTTNLPAAPASSTQILNWAMSTDMGTALTNITTIDGVVDAIQAKTTNLPATPASSTGFAGLMPSTGTTAIGDAVWSAINESTQSYADQVRNIRAAIVGEAAGGGTASITFRDAADSINRLTFAATTDGNRTAVTILTT